MQSEKSLNGSEMLLEQASGSSCILLELRPTIKSYMVRLTFLSLLPIWVSLHLKLRADGSGVRMEYGTSPIDTTRQAVKHVGHLIRPVTGFSVLSRQ